MNKINKIFIAELVALVIIIVGDAFVVVRDNRSKTLLSPIPENILGVNSEGPAAVLYETNVKKAGSWPVVNEESKEVNTGEESFVSRSLLKESYSVAVFGDSMEDTMGSNLDYLSNAMMKKYPGVKISFYNYGIGSQNVEMGLTRLCQKFEYKERRYPSLCDLKPDVVIIGSFAYNPFSPHNRIEHWLTLAKLVGEVKRISGNVYMLSEISPIKGSFGVGPMGVNWSNEVAYLHASHIDEQLENAIGLAKTLQIPLIDCYNSSKNGLTGEGKSELVNSADGIHPSIAGHIFMANLMAQKITLY